MWISNPKFNKKRPGWFELSGGWEESTSHTIVFDVGVFEPLADNAGYVFLCKATEITGFKKLGDWQPGKFVCVEIHRSTYKLNKNVNDVWVDVDAEPVEGEKLLCNYLDSDAGKELTKTPFKGRFNINGANAFTEIFPVLGIKTYLKEIEMLTAEAYGELKPSDAIKGGNSKGGYPPVLAGDHAASRLKFIKEFFKEIYCEEKLPDALTCSSYIYGAKTDELAATYLELLRMCLGDEAK